jgi:hypothetical protein
MPDLLLVLLLLLLVLWHVACWHPPAPLVLLLLLLFAGHSFMLPFPGVPIAPHPPCVPQQQSKAPA